MRDKSYGRKVVAVCGYINMRCLKLLTVHYDYI